MQQIIHKLGTQCHGCALEPPDFCICAVCVCSPFWTVLKLKCSACHTVKWEYAVGCIISDYSFAWGKKLSEMTLELCVAVQSCVQGVQEWAEDAALRSTSVEDQGRWGIVAHSDFCLSGSPGSSCTEIRLVPESGASQPVWQALWC